MNRLVRFVEDPQGALDRPQQAERDAGAAFERVLGAPKMFRAQVYMQAYLGSYAKFVVAEERGDR